jgi:hypothetical protein
MDRPDTLSVADEHTRSRHCGKAAGSAPPFGRQPPGNKHEAPTGRKGRAVASRENELVSDGWCL